MLLILRSLMITCSIATVVATVFWSTGGDFYRAFILTIAIQIGVSWIYASISNRYFNIKQQQIDNERIKEFTKQGIDVECAYCKTPNLIPVRFDDDNDFTCINCDKENATYINVTITQKAAPLNMSPLLVNTLNANEQQAIDRLG